jgi:hypothetical protein
MYKRRAERQKVKNLFKTTCRLNQEQLEELSETF